MSRATSDITETERFVGMGLMDLTASLLLLGGVLVAMVLEDFSLSLFALIPLVLLLALTLRFGMVIRPRFKRVQEQMGQLSSTMQESMTGIQVVKAFAREADELRKFDAANEDWFSKRFGIIKIWANNWPTFTFILLISVFLLLLIGGPRAIEGTVTVGSLFRAAGLCDDAQRPRAAAGFPRQYGRHVRGQRHARFRDYRHAA